MAIEHKNAALGKRHALPNWEYANAAARAAATGFVSGDLYKVARQTDNNSLWQLIATTPTWKSVSYEVDDSTIQDNAGSLRVKDDGVTFAKMQNIATNKLLGRSTASSGDIEELSIGSGLSLSSGTLTAGGSVIYPIDAPPTSPANPDDEFSTGSTIDTAGTRFSGANAWTLYESAGGNVGSEVNTGAGIIWLTVSGSNSIQGFYQALAAGNFKYRMKLSIEGANSTNNYGGFFLHDSVGGKLEAFYLRPHVPSTANLVALEKGRWTNQTTFDATGLVRDIVLSPGFSIYLEIERSSTTLTYRYSATGRRFIQFTTNSETAHMANSPNRIGIFYNTSTTNGPHITVEWFRKVA